jgi:hypothetical protein
MVRKLIKKNGQSAVEFAVVLPVLILTSLGLVQLGLIFINSMMLKYTAFMTARVAAVYTDENERRSNSDRAFFILKSLQGCAAGYGGNILSNAMDGFVNTLRETAASKLQGESIKIEDIKLDSSKGDFIKVTVTYCMPLTVPVVNKVFGLMQNKNRFDILNTATVAAYAGFPFYTLKSSAIMRLQ